MGRREWVERRQILTTPSLRAQRSNPESYRGGSLDCFVARAPRNDEESPRPHAGIRCMAQILLPSRSRR
ncbi:hypothetical protein EHH60_17540 [Bradyrhizobium sp. RP6]|nr:hypothetical protein EHH60_17540 [Bradyrhizobium sp. RP6]